MAVLPPSATFQEFSDYVVDLHGPKSHAELGELWEWRQKLQSIKVITGAGFRATLPVDERDLTLNQREAKLVSEAKAQGRNIEPVGARWV